MQFYTRDPHTTLELPEPQFISILMELRLWDGDNLVGEISPRDNTEIRRQLDNLMSRANTPALYYFRCMLQVAWDTQKPIYWR
jgi:hypothetical protein